MLAFTAVAIHSPPRDLPSKPQAAPLVQCHARGQQSYGWGFFLEWMGAEDEELQVPGWESSIVWCSEVHELREHVLDCRTLSDCLLANRLYREAAKSVVLLGGSTCCTRGLA